MNTPAFKQIVATANWIFGLASDGSVWRKAINSDASREWDKIS